MLPVEREIKLDLQNEENYRRLIDHFSEEKAEDDLENFFFDAEDGALSKSGWALRIRKERGGFRVTAKGPPEAATAALTVRPEIESSLPDIDISAMIEAGLKISQIPVSVAGHLDKFISGKTLRLVAAFKTRRTTILHGTEGPELRFEIDRTVFTDGSTDYELEVELADAAQYERAMRSIKSIFSRQGIPLKTRGESKFARALRRTRTGT